MLVLCIMLSLFGCKKQDDEQTAASGELTEQTEQAPEKENETDEKKPEPEKENETEPEKEDKTDEVYPEEKIERPKNVDHITIKKDGIYYGHYFSGTVAASVQTAPTIYNDLDQSLFEPTDEWVDAEYMKFTPVDDFDTVLNVRAQVYKAPDYVQNDKFAYVLAAKPVCEDKVIIFSRLKEKWDGETYKDNLERLNHYYGFECLGADKLKSIEVRDKNKASFLVEITDTKLLEQIYNSLCEFKYVKPYTGTNMPNQSQAQTYEQYCIILHFKDGSKHMEWLTTGYHSFGGYIANEAFEQSILSQIPEQILKAQGK